MSIGDPFIRTARGYKFNKEVDNLLFPLRLPDLQSPAFRGSY